MLDLPLIASIVSIVGVGVLSCKRDFSKHGWWICLISNGLWLLFGLEIGEISFMVTQAFFMVTSLNGIKNNFKWNHRRTAFISR